MQQNNFVFVDIETTGSRVNYDRIIEIGILRCENGILKREYQSLVNPEMYLSPFIENMTGIHSHELESAPTFREIKDQVHELIADSIFVAHNVRFDYGFIKNELKKCNIPFSAKQFCTVKLSRYLYPQLRHHNLDSIIERFNIKCENRHRAFDDAKAIWIFFNEVQKVFPKDFVEKAMDSILKKPSLPINIPEEMIESLPESPGVYIFYGKAGIPLYVGKSINIKDRVKSHFAADINSTKEANMAREVESIEYKKTAGELGALFLESHLVKEMQPVYNRQLRACRKLLVLKKVTNDQGYHTVTLEDVDIISPEEIENIIMIFKSRKQAKDYLVYIAKNYLLCQKILGVENAKKSCFGYQLEQCNGACTGLEMPEEYNKRFEQAFAETVIRPWPYKGPILIKEQSDESGEAFIVDKWCLIGKVKYNEEGVEKYEENDFTFDFDTYKILNRSLKNPAVQKKIQYVPDISLLQFAH